LLNYLDILYPNGEPIDAIKERDSNGYATYKTEVTKFIQLVETWAHDDDFHTVTLYRMTGNPEKVATANWKEIRQMLSSISRAERLSHFNYGAKIQCGDIRRILLRMKELAEQ
jgi:hypothetical protein